MISYSRMNELIMEANKKKEDDKKQQEMIKEQQIMINRLVLEARVCPECEAPIHRLYRMTEIFRSDDIYVCEKGHKIRVVWDSTSSDW